MPKVLLLFPKNYTLLDTFKAVFEHRDFEVKTVDFIDFFNPQELKIHRYLLRMPWKINWTVQRHIAEKVNKKYRSIFDEFRPDIVYIYNDQKLDPSTIEYFNKSSITAFFLGDHPLFIKNRPDNLATILQGQHIFSPDSYWMEQMALLGVKNLHFLTPGYSKSLNYRTKISLEAQNAFGSDIVFVGRQYHDTWGYKRALFANQFVGQNFKIYGDAAWHKWFRYFPELKSHFVENSSYLSFETVNTILNASKIYPVDANSGLINGMHIRVFECIGSGILPLVEYRKDIETIFEGIEIPFIRDYSNANDLAKYWISNDKERQILTEKLSKFVDNNYSVEKIATRLIDIL